MRRSSRTIGLARLLGIVGIAAAALSVIAAGCSDDDSATTTTTRATAEDTPTDSATVDTVDQLPGPFELTTADGSINIAGTVEDCLLIDGSSAQIKFSGSVQDVTIDAEGGAGSVTVRGEFDGVIDSAVVDTDTGDVSITGTAPGAGGDAETTEFEVTGRCEV